MSTPLHPLSIYGSHDASLCIKPKPDFYRVYELERLTRIRNYRLNTDPQFRERMIFMRELIKKEYSISDWGSCFYAQLEGAHLEILKEVFGFIHFEEMSHHMGHAAGALHQSPFDECLIISSDGGGHELQEGEGIATFCAYLAGKTTGIKKLAQLPIDVCTPYTLLAIPIAEIKKSDVWTKYLTYAGKVMGLAAYGQVQPSWIEPMKKFYYQHPADLENLRLLGNEIGLDLSGINTLSGQPAYDLAATSQHVFEELSFNAILPFIERHRLPVILTGGAAMNVLLNEKLKRKISYPVFIPVNPNDSGLSMGFHMLRCPPDKPVNPMYSGFPILDRDQLEVVAKKHKARMASVKELARLICKGKIIGIVHGDSEAGARALGHRSIVCDPSRPEMKEKINKIKQREFFRPFAPVCKAEDVNTYFHFEGETPFMSYAPFVKEEWVKKVPSIVHIDNTARVQTISKKQNEFFYMLIDSVETISGIGIILNTSLNVRGEPILTRMEDAIKVWQTTELDCLYIEGYLFEKKK